MRKQIFVSSALSALTCYICPLSILLHKQITLIDAAFSPCNHNYSSILARQCRSRGGGDAGRGVGRGGIIGRRIHQMNAQTSRNDRFLRSSPKNSKLTNHKLSSAASSSTSTTTAAASSSSLSSSTNQLEAPNVKKIIFFAIPAIGIWLCGPLLSLIDTSAVGLLSGTSQQAALNPAITITEDGALLVSFMYTATTNLVAAAFEYDRNNDETKSRTITAVITSLQLAVFVGLLFGIGLTTLSTISIRSLIGKTNQNPEVIAAAVKYVRIRAIGMPAAVVIGAAQSACLGMKDIRSPLLVMVAAAFVNLIGDIVLVPNASPWLGGAAGAAWATVLSQYAALIMFLRWLKTRPKIQPPLQPTNGKDESQLATDDDRGIEYVHDDNNDHHPSSKTKETPFTTRGILHGHFRYKDLFKFPSTKNTPIKKFIPYVIPVTTTAIGRVSGYVAMSHVVSSALGTIDLAAQQIVLAFFLCFIPMCDSLNLTAQSFVPGIFEYAPNNGQTKKIGRGDVVNVEQNHENEYRIRKKRSDVMKQTVNNFLKAGGIFGFVLMGVISCIPLFSKFFSHDLNVISSVNSTTLYISIYALLSGIVCAGEGLLLGQKDLKFLSNSFTAFFFIVPYLLLRLKNAALRGAQDIGLSTVWRVFTIYQSVRCVLWLLRLRYLSQKMEREIENPIS